MLDSNSLALLNRRLPWLFIETVPRATGFLSVTLIVAILALTLELGHPWNLYAAGGQAVKAGDDYPVLLQSLGSVFSKTTGGELVVLLGGSAIRELTVDDSLLSKELTNQCGREIQFVNLGSSNQTFSESWDIAALAPEGRRRLFLVGLNPFRLTFDDRDVIAELSSSPTGIPASFSLLWTVALHTGHVGGLDRIFASIARQLSFGAKLRFADLFDPNQPVAVRAAEDPFQPDRSSYREPVWTESRKLRQTYQYIAIRALGFHDGYRTGAKWYNRFYDHFQGPESDVKFLMTPTDATFAAADKLVSGDLRDAVELLGGESRMLDLRSLDKNLDSNDFFDVQHLVARGRVTLQPLLLAEVSRVLGCTPGAPR